MEQIEYETYKKIKKLLKVGILVIIIPIIFVLVYMGWVVFDTVRTHVTKIGTNEITIEEKNKLVEYNFLELESYPSSLEFISIREEAGIRETQFYITFSVDKDESYLYDIERDNRHIAGPSSILKKSEDNEKVIYEFGTNFMSAGRGSEWNFIEELVDKYK